MYTHFICQHHLICKEVVEMLKIEWLSLFTSLFLMGATWAIISVFGNPPLIDGWYVHNIPETVLCFSVGVFCGFSFFTEDKWKKYCVLCWVLYVLVVVAGSTAVGFDFMVFAAIIALPFPIGFCLAGLYRMQSAPTIDNK